MPTIQDRFKLRRGLAADLAAVNEIPVEGELVYETDQGFSDGKYKIKLGDGVTHYNDLPYVQLGGGVEAIVAGYGTDVDDTDPKNPVVSSTLGSIALTGREPTYADLPTTGLTSGDAYYVESDGRIYIWDGTAFPAEGSGASSSRPMYPFGSLIQNRNWGGLSMLLVGDVANLAPAVQTQTAAFQDAIASSVPLSITGGQTPYTVTVRGLPSGISYNDVTGNLDYDGTTTLVPGSAYANVIGNDGWESGRLIAISNFIYATLDSANMAAGLTLSNGDTTVTAGSSPSGWKVVRSNSGKSSGKFYIEVTDNVMGGGSSASALYGFEQDGDSLTTYPGSSTLGANRFGYQPNGARYSNGPVTPSFTPTTPANGSWVGFAIDLDAGKAWVRQDSATWFGGGDPAAGINPAFTFTAGTELFLAVGGGATGQQSTINLGALAFNEPAPTGFTDLWGA